MTYSRAGSPRERDHHARPHGVTCWPWLLWPGRHWPLACGAVAATCVAKWYCRWPRRAAVLPTRTAPRHSRCQCRRLTIMSMLFSAPLRHCWPGSRPPLPRARGRAHHRLAIYGAAPRGPCWSWTRALVHIVYAHGFMISPTASRQGKPKPSPHVAPRLSLSLLPPSSHAIKLSIERSPPFNSAHPRLHHQVLSLPDPTQP